MKSISFLVFSLVSVEQKKSFPIYTKQISKFKTNNKTEKKSESKRVGRPKGSKNINRKNIRVNGLFRMVNLCLGIILKTVKIANLKYFVYDGAFGNNIGIQSILRRKLHLISKLKKNSALYLKFVGEQKGRGGKRKYGAKIDTD